MELSQKDAENTDIYKNVVTFLVNNPDIPMQLASRLMQLDFTGSFDMLGVSTVEALAMDSPTLMRLINEKTGIVAASVAQKEQETLENNRKFFEDMSSRNRIVM